MGFPLCIAFPRTKEFQFFLTHRLAEKSVKDTFPSSKGFHCPMGGLGSLISICWKKFSTFPSLPNIDCKRMLSFFPHLRKSTMLPNVPLGNFESTISAEELITQMCHRNLQFKAVNPVQGGHLKPLDQALHYRQYFWNITATSLMCCWADP